MATFRGVSPVLLIADVNRAVAFYRDRLGFNCEVHGDPPDFVVAGRNAAVILLALAADRDRIIPNWHASIGRSTPTSGWTIRCDVRRSAGARRSD